MSALGQRWTAEGVGENARSPAKPSESRRQAGVLLFLILLANAVIHIWGAWEASPGTRTASIDLTLLREWISGTTIEKLEEPPGHLTKPGFLLLLRAMLPEGGTESEIRRMLFFQALWMVAGGAALCVVLWVRGQPRAALATAVFLLVCVLLRDAGDYIATEPFAIGFGLFFIGALLLLRRPAWAMATGATLALLALVRPNTSYLFLILGVITLIEGNRPRRRAAWLLFGFALGLLVLVAAARVTGFPVNPFGMRSSQALLFATADYAWPPDLPERPGNLAREEEERWELEQTRRRWSALSATTPLDRARSFFWRTTHSIFSAEQYPGRWHRPLYMKLDRTLRYWWWLAAVLLFSAAIASSLSGVGSWRWVALLVLLLSMAQGLLFGAETRYALPLLPFAFVGLALSLRRPSRTALAAAASVGLLLVAAIAWAPDVAATDYALMRRNQVLEQKVSAHRFPPGNIATVHFRMLAVPAEGGIGFETFAAQRKVLVRPEGIDERWPAFASFTLTADELRQARREGLRLRVRALADATRSGALAYPVVPTILSRSSRVDGDARLTSAFGGSTRGGMPIWVHAGADRRVDVPRR